jgi:hypothetical protein
LSDRKREKRVIGLEQFSSKLIIELKVETCVGELKGAALYLLSREALLAPTLADEELWIKANFPKTAKR